MRARFSFLPPNIFDHATVLKLELHKVQDDQLAILFEVKGCFCPEPDDEAPIAEDLARSLLSGFLAEEGGRS